MNEFDANQTRALVTIESDLHTMATWISDIEGLFTDGVTAIDFPMDKWMDLTAQNMLKTDLTQYTAEMDGISGMTGENIQPTTMLGTDTDGGKSVMYPQGFSNGPSDLYGTGVYTLPGMASQAIPLRNAGVSGASVLGNRAVITSSGKSIAGKVTSAPATKVKKPEKKKKENKVLGFLKGAADFIILDDLKTIADPNASLLNKGFAIFAVTPAGKGLKAARLGFKLVKKSPFGVGPIKIKSTDKVVNATKSQQRSVIKSVENKSAKLKTNKQKGNYGEMKMDVHFENQGYNRIGKDRVTGLDDKIVKGIDGVYEKVGPPPKFVIGEAKYGSSRLGHTKDGKQMSDGWINGGKSSTRLESSVGIEKADEILLEGYDKVLTRISSNGSVNTVKVNSVGNIIK